MDLLGSLWNLALTEWMVGGVVFFLVLYILGTWNYGHFSSRGADYLKPLPFVGCMAPLIFRTNSFPYTLDDIYYKFKNHNFVGIYQFFSPVLFVRDPELIRRITVKDFDHFVDHRDQIAADPIFGKNLFSLKGQKWRDMRATLSPAFSSSKMKGMFNFMNQCGEQLADYLQAEIQKQPKGKIYSAEMKDLFTRFTNDVIATSAFGVRTDSLKEKNNEFYLMGKELTNFLGIKSIIFLGYMLSPQLMKFLKIRVFSKTNVSFYANLVHDTITTREREGIVRPDMLHLLMQARGGEIKAEAGEEDMGSGELKANKTKLTEEDIVAQAIIFFFAGFDTASTLLSFASHQLAVHEDVQRRVQEEIDQVITDGKVTYENVQKVKYLDMVLSETLRLYPPGVFLDRKAVKDFTIPASESQPAYTLKKGEDIWIPVHSLHRDPKYFPDPEKFDPERFNDENKHNINPFTYMPFGSGPRFCIGQRFALLEAKVAIIHVLSRFNFHVIEKTPVPIVLTSKGFQMAVDGGLWIGISHREK